MSRSSKLTLLFLSVTSWCIWCHGLIMFSIRVSSLNLTISLDEIKEKMFKLPINIYKFKTEWTLGKWVNGCCLTKCEHIFSYVIVQWDDNNVCFIQDQHALLDFNSARSLKNQSMSLHSDTLSCFRANLFLLFLQFHSLWSDLSRAQTKDLPYLKLACWPLQNENWFCESIKYV